MIFYFTGTGNSGYIASEVAKGTNDEIISISKLINNKESLEFNLKDGENIGFVFPVYAWAPPKMVLEFIKNAKFNNFNSNYIFCVATCAGIIGNTMKIMIKTLNDKGLQLNSGFSVRMPGNYIIMGDVDSKEVENKKLEESKEQVKVIDDVINNKEKDVFKVVKGPLPFVLTKVINPMFNKYAMDASKFYVDDKCISCGLCERVCNCNNIKLVNGRPVWGKDCSQCLACINLCPSRAIEYGEKTVKKGRYKNPYFKIK